MPPTQVSRPAGHAPRPADGTVSTLGHRLRHYATMSLLAAFFIFPFAFMVVGSFKPDGRVLTEGDSWRAVVPTQPTFENYTDAFERADFGQLFLNSTLITAVIVVGNLVVNSMCGYALARLRFPGRGALVSAVVALTIIPFQAVAIPLFFMVAEVRWIDTYHVQILPFLASPLFIYLFYTFFLSIPMELEDAARVDGAGTWTIFWRVVVPLAQPAFATVTILGFLFAWGELLWPVLVTRGPEVRPLPLGIAVFQTTPPIAWGDIMAFATMMTLPLIVVFLVFQRSFIQGLARSGLKG